MQFSALALIALVSSTAAALPDVLAKRGSVCFDFGDCLIQGGGMCVYPSGAFIGTCEKSTPTSTMKGHHTTMKGGPTPTPTNSGKICFDDGDCLIQGGGTCVRGPGQIIFGYCQKKGM